MDIYYAENGSPFGTNILINDDEGVNAQSKPVIGVDNDGHPYVVWVDERNGHKDIYYRSSVVVGAPLPCNTTTNGSTGEVTVTAVGRSNLQLVIPELPDGVEAEDITITEMETPPEMPSGEGAFGLTYRFGPAGARFSTPVTVRIPLVDDPGYSTYRVMRYDPALPTYPWTEDGIYNPATKVVPAVGDPYLEVQIDHFSIFGTGGSVGSSGGGGGGGGGGCALSPYGGNDCSPLEFFLPFGLLSVLWFGYRTMDKRRGCL